MTGHDEKNFYSVQYSAAPQTDANELDGMGGDGLKGHPDLDDCKTVFIAERENDDKYLPLSTAKTAATSTTTATTTTTYPPLPNFITLRPPDKSRRNCCQKWALYSCLVGFIFIVASIICAFLMKPFVEDKILDNLPIREGSEVYKGWKEPPVTPVVSFRVFNLTNQDAFLKGLDKPNLVEVGPYVYRQKMEKVEVNFSTSEPSVTYKVAKQYFFAPELSGPGTSEDDYVIVPNIPLFGAFQKLAKESSVAKNIFKGLLESYEFGIDHGPFLNIKVKELLWGYPSVLASMGRVQQLGCGGVKQTMKSNAGWDDFGGLDDDWGDSADSWKSDGRTRTRKQVERNVREPNPCEIEPDHLTPFGLFVGRNGTGLDIRSVNTGSEKIEDRGLMIAWHNKRTLDYWTKPECNVVGGRDPASLPLNIQKTDSLEIFIGQLCRTLPFKYVSEGQISEEFQTFRFTPFENSFDAPEDNPDNECYCLQQPCLPSGILDIRGCQQWSPIFMSWPHFLYGDADLRRGVHGMHPDAEKHAFILDIAPKYGIALRALARLQMNVIIEKNSGFGYFDKINQNQIIYPFMWLEDGVLGPSEIIVKKIRFLLNLPNNIQNLVAMIGLALGLLLLIPEIVFWARSCCHNGQPDKEKSVEKQ